MAKSVMWKATNFSNICCIGFFKYIVLLCGSLWKY